MAEMLDIEAISRATSIPPDIIKDYLEGEISDDVLKNYDPAKPPEIKVIEKKKFVRSKIIGVTGPNGNIATAFSAYSAIITAQHNIVGLFDLYDFSVLPLYLNLNQKEQPFNINYLWNEDTEIELKTLNTHSQISNLYIFQKPLNQMYKDNIIEIINKIGNDFSVSFVDIPFTLNYLKTITNYLDILYIVLPQSMVGITYIEKAINFLKNSAIHERCIIVFNDDGSNSLPLPECKRIVRNKFGIEVVENLPYDEKILSNVNDEKLIIHKYPNSQYIKQLTKILQELIPSNQNFDKKSLWDKLKGFVK